MPSRKLLLRVLLLSLAVAAVLGAAMILLGAEEAIARVVGTSLATAGAAALMLGCSILMDRDNARRAGTLGMVAVVFEFLLAVLLIWISDNYFARGLEERLGLTLFFLPCCVIPMMVCLSAANLPAARIAGWTGVALSLLTLAILMAGTWFESTWSPRWRFFGVAGALAGFGVASLATLVGAGQDRRHWRWIGIAAALAGFLIAAYAITFDIHGDSPLMTYLITIAAVTAHVNLAMQVPLTPPQRWVRYVTVSFAILTGALVAIIVGHDLDDSDFLGRVAGACGLIAGCGSLALLIFARLNRKLGNRPVLAAISRITLVCPGCERKQTLPTGDARCAHCGLLIHTRLVEPRCANCDYSLFMLQSDRCPECGTPVSTGITEPATA